MMCQHKIERGPDVPRRYGSWRSEICVLCGMWRTTTHHGELPSAWHPFEELNEELDEGEDA